jgi:hypothetical protein
MRERGIAASLGHDDICRAGKTQADERLLVDVHDPVPAKSS